MDAQSLLHRAMLSPTFYPSENGPVTFSETHISRLYFTTQHVYKVKKAVSLGFLDFSSLDQRRYYCLEEVRLNRRLCPQTYLGVLPIYFGKNGYQLNGPGEIKEYAVHMKRLPEDRMLDQLIRNKVPHLEKDMDRLGHRLAFFHKHAEIVRHPTLSYRQKTAYNWKENFNQIEPYVGDTIELEAKTILQDWVEAFIRDKGTVLTTREKQGFVRDGHGDLHAEHICLSDPICIYDCIEFSERFRICDIVEDVAFLLMDLEFRKRWELATTLLGAYRTNMDMGTDWEDLLPFFKVYRAFVRGKVNSILAGDIEAAESVQLEAKSLARRYFSLALGYLCPQMIILTCGLMGTGKTTVAKGLCRAINALHLRSDEVRKELHGLPVLRREEDSFNQGLYTRNVTQKTYDALLDMAEKSLQKEQSVLVDASFSQQDQRNRFFEMARQRGVPVFLIVTECPAETALNRLDQRQKQEMDASDGRRELYGKQAACFDPVQKRSEVITVDTSQDVDYTVHIILRHIIGKARARI
ncbi:bifunctional aminoglycoside phosphotransferase/ATP-binding protein [Desulfuromonas sp. AOP6]|uniref:bifunctional aminoglycoside phosphotransferase/ATP-binding protein n=1 Tax=Desulfuromonas sp. AOP6 TaxID=1566351 RepID=UPI00127C0FE4|nr:bifunctional aminoglycoside phosphotransferase/ATP-binding protein [Desulfuromonas sp. AOP6]BCA79647.1 kinase [Desulfuromonas sp. AOP6]